MIFCEPTPCGRFLFASALVLVNGSPVHLKACRVIEQQRHRQLQEVLEELASDCIAELMVQALQCGLTSGQIEAMLGDEPDHDFEKRKIT